MRDLDLDQREVVARIVAEHAGLIDFLIGQRHGQLGAAAGDVIIGKNFAVARSMTNPVPVPFSGYTPKKLRVYTVDVINTVASRADL